MIATGEAPAGQSSGIILNILFLTQILPYPPDAGPRVKTWHVLRYLAARGHRISLVTYLREDEKPHLPAVAELCEQVIPVPIRRSRLRDVLYLARAFLTGRPFLIERDDLPTMRAAVRRALREQEIQVIHADQLSMAQFALWGRDQPESLPRRPAILFDSHNAVWMIVDRMADTILPFLRPLMRLEARRVRRYEAELVEAFDHTLAVTAVDRAALLAPGSRAGKITVIPIAVDTAALRPTHRKPGSQNILTLGTLHYPPNADGIRWFLNEVYPRLQAQLPDASLTIIGKSPPGDFLAAAARDPSLAVTGYVPDLQPYMNQAAVVVVPVRAGGGMRVRILEAFARAMPVVTTTVGLEGIDAKPGRDVLVADSADEFSAAVRQVLESPDRQEELARRGRALAESKYDWHKVLEHMDRVYEDLAAGRG